MAVQKINLSFLITFEAFRHTLVLEILNSGNAVPSHFGKYSLSDRTMISKVTFFTDELELDMLAICFASKVCKRTVDFVGNRSKLHKIAFAISYDFSVKLRMACTPACTVRVLFKKLLNVRNSD